LNQLKEIICQRHRLDDILIRLVVPLSSNKFHRPRSGYRPVTQRRPIAVLLHDVEIPLIEIINEAKTDRGVGDILKQVEEVPVLSRAVLERDDGEREMPLPVDFPRTADEPHDPLGIRAC